MAVYKRTLTYSVVITEVATKNLHSVTCMTFKQDTNLQMRMDFDTFSNF